MNLLLSAVLWENQCKADLSQVSLIDWARELQLAGVEFRPFWQDLESEIAAAAALTAQYGLSVVYAANDGLLAGDEDQTRQALANLRHSLALAAKLGAKILRMNVATGTFNPDMARTDWWLKAIRELLADAQKHNLILAVENGPSKHTGDPDLLWQLLTTVESPHFKLTFDTANWLYAGAQPADALQRFYPYIAYVHLKDAVCEDGILRHSHPGSGLVDVRGLYRQLLEQGYQGLAALEFPGGPDPLARAKSVAAYLNSSHA